MSEFETFARAKVTPDKSLSAVELRDHAHAMLIAAADDIESAQSAKRSSVLRLYEQTGDTDPGGVRRFNESINEALTVSLLRYEQLTPLHRVQFVGILGHDLRNPLSAITAGAGLLVASAEGNERQAITARRILSSALRMAA